jgi:DNA replication and repair protein RecF
MLLTRLAVHDFRCFESAEIEPHPQTTLLIGRNGQGKTSLLEAACVLLRLQSPRTSTRSDLIRFHASTCAIEGALGDHRLRFAQNATTRRLALDGVTCGRTADYLAHSGLVVWMDHGDMSLARGGSEHRRRFLDFAASQIFPGYLHALRGYERALRSRNYLLKKDAVINWRQADAYARVMDEFARTLTGHREALVERMVAAVQEMHAALSGGAEEARIEHARGYEGESLFDAIASARDAEAQSRATAHGVHRDDLRLWLDGRDACSFASEGQQRTFAMAMKLAQARVLHEARGEPPLLLIDDIFGELDKTRRRAVLEHLPAASQKIITTTHLDWMGDCALAGDVWMVEGRAVQRGRDPE